MINNAFSVFTQSWTNHFFCLSHIFFKWRVLKREKKAVPQMLLFERHRV